MELLYDIEQSDGKVVSGIYFIKYTRPIRGGKNNHILTYGVDSICAFDKNDKKVFVDLLNSNIIRIYDADTGENYTEMFVEKHLEVEKKYGYPLPFPIARRTEMVELITQ